MSGIEALFYALIPLSIGIKQLSSIFALFYKPCKTFIRNLLPDLEGSIGFGGSVCHCLYSLPSQVYHMIYPHSTLFHPSLPPPPQIHLPLAGGASVSSSCAPNLEAQHRQYAGTSSRKAPYGTFATADANSMLIQPMLKSFGLGFSESRPR